MSPADPQDGAGESWRRRGRDGLLRPVEKRGDRPNPWRLPRAGQQREGSPRLMEAMALRPEEGCALLEQMVLEKDLPAQDNFTGILISCK